MKILGYALGALLVLGLVALIFGFQAWILMLLWNFLAGYFGFKTITFWVSLVIVMFLSTIGTIVNKSTSKK